MKEVSFEIGQLVCSKRGRDCGQFYLILEKIDNTFVYLVDGEKRRIENPKRKNVKHLKFFPVVAEQLAVHWKAGEQVSNTDVRKVLGALKHAHVEGVRNEGVEK